MQEYIDGFGDLNAEFWLGLDHMHLLTIQPRKVQLDVLTEQGDSKYAQFSNFSVAGQPDYTVSVSGYLQNHGGLCDYVMGFADGYRFVRGCPVSPNFKYGWWFRGCGLTSINADYQPNAAGVRFSVYCNHDYIYIILSTLKIQ